MSQTNFFPFIVVVVVISVFLILLNEQLIRSFFLFVHLQLCLDDFIDSWVCINVYFHWIFKNVIDNYIADLFKRKHSIPDLKIENAAIINHSITIAYQFFILIEQEKWRETKIKNINKKTLNQITRNDI